MSKDSMGDGPYRVGNHSPLNVWCEPGQSTTEQVCMATSPRWAGRIVAALNEQDARSVGERAVSDAVASAHLSGVDLPADWVETLGKVARGEVTADDAVQAVVAPMLAAKDRDVEQIRIRLAQTLNLPHSRTLDQLIDDVSEVFSGWVRMAREIGGLRRELKLTEGFRQQYAEERDEALDDAERLRSALSKEYDEDANPTDPSVGWDLTFGCRVTFGHDSDGYRATVSISDQTQRDGIAVRGVTRGQIRAYAFQLIRLTEVIEDGAS